MFKRVFVVVVLLMGILGTCYGSEEPIYETNYSSLYIQSVTVVNDRNTEILKVKIKEVLKNNENYNYAIHLYRINRSTRDIIYDVMEYYDKNNNFAFHTEWGRLYKHGESKFMDNIVDKVIEKEGK